MKIVQIQRSQEDVHTRSRVAKQYPLTFAEKTDSSLDRTNGEPKRSEWYSSNVRTCAFAFSWCSRITAKMRRCGSGLSSQKAANIISLTLLFYAISVSFFTERALVGQAIYDHVSSGTNIDVVARKMICIYLLKSNWQFSQYLVTLLTQLTRLNHRPIKIAEKTMGRSKG